MKAGLASVSTTSRRRVDYLEDVELEDKNKLTLRLDSKDLVLGTAGEKSVAELRLSQRTPRISDKAELQRKKKQLELKRRFSSEWKKREETQHFRVELGKRNWFWPKSSVTRRSRLLVHHNSSFRRLWDFVTCLLLVVLVVTLPLQLAFELEHSSLNWVAWVQTGWFIADLFLNFFTTHTDERTQRLVQSHSRIAKEYASNWFVIDFISSIPFEEIPFVDGRESSHIARGLKLIKLLKIMRLLRVDRIIMKIQQKQQIKYSTIAVVKFIVLLLMGAHWLGLLFWLVSTSTTCNEPYCSWVITYAESHQLNSPKDGQCFAAAGCTDWSLGSKYLVCLYWAITTMSTIGFGDITPKSDQEVIFTLFSMLAGTVAFAHGLTNMCSILFYHNKNQVDYETSMDEMYEFMSRHKIEKPLAMRIQKFLWYQMHVSQVDRTTKRFADMLTPVLGESISIKQMRNSFPLTEWSSKYMLFNLFGEASSLHCEIGARVVQDVLSLGDIIVPLGRRCGYVYYIADGSLMWECDGHRQVLSKHCSFGETACLLDNRRQASTIEVTALGNCTIFRISRKHLLEALQHVPFVERNYKNYLAARRANGYLDYQRPDDFSTEKTEMLNQMCEDSEDEANHDLMFAFNRYCPDKDDERRIAVSNQNRDAELSEHKQCVDAGALPGLPKGIVGRSKSIDILNGLNGGLAAKKHLNALRSASLDDRKRGKHLSSVKDVEQGGTGGAESSAATPNLLRQDSLSLLRSQRVTRHDAEPSGGAGAVRSI